jgi:hypothetical protein
VKFAATEPDPHWHNMDTYSYHAYEKTGAELAEVYRNLTDTIKTESPGQPIPVILTEHNAHLASTWNSLPTTPDTFGEASRIANQIVALAESGMASHFIFKFSVTRSFASSRDVAKNGLHWGELSQAPHHVSDTTLMAESSRLMMSMKRARIHPVSAENNPSARIRFLASANADDKCFYVYIVNDGTSRLNLSIDLSEWADSVQAGTQLPVESVQDGYYGEISHVLTVPETRSNIGLFVHPFSTHRLTVQVGLQRELRFNATMTCTARAGDNSQKGDCRSESMFVGTSSSSEHERTSVAVMQFPVDAQHKDFKSLLKVNS